MAMVNVNNLLNIKDSRWLQLEVCREFQRNKCSRPDTECKFAHPPTNVEVQNGRVTACYDSIKGRCNREKPPCKYFHPPHHLKDQLLINGRNHLALKNALMQQMGLAPGQPVVGPGQVPAVATNPYLAGVTSQAYNPYFAAGPLVPLCTSDPTGATLVSQLGVPQQNVGAQQKIQRDRLETYPQMLYKRPGGDKGGVPVYQPQNASSNMPTYQQLMQLQQPFVPVSSTSIQHSNATMTTASTSSVGGMSGASAVQEHSNNVTGLANGSLESHGIETGIKRVKSDSAGENETNDLQDGSNSLSLNNTGGSDLDEEAKAESANKRMRVTTIASSGGVPVSSSVSQVPNHVGQNNAAYVAAAQSYHNALAAMTYTGVALQTNKAQQQQASGNVPQTQGYPGAAVAAAAAALQQQQQHHHQQQQQQQQLHQNNMSAQSQQANQGHSPIAQQQHQQQQQLISQYQAMAAALANQGTFQGGLQNAQVSSSVTSPTANSVVAGSSGLNLNINAATAAGLPFGVNPLLASFPQLAAAQRASLFANQQGQGAYSLAQFNPAAFAGLSGAGGAGSNPNAGAVSFPFGLQFAGHNAGNSAAANAHQFQAGNQQALLAAYGQYARSSVAVSAAPTMTSQQIYVGNPAAAAAAAAAAGTNALQAGVKRLRPQ